MNIFFFTVSLGLGTAFAETRADDQKIALDKKIKVASIDWCPQICPDQKQRGYIHDVVLAIFADSPYEIEIDVMPWSRAIRQTKRGARQAVLSPAKAESPELIFPEEAVGTQYMCFFTAADNGWTYAGIPSLEGQNIGVAPDTSIEELNEYLSAHRDQFQFIPYNDQYISSSIEKLLAGRLDSFLFTLNTTLYEARQLGHGDRIRVAGCVNRANIYMAFTPVAAQKEKVGAMIHFFDQAMQQLKATGAYDQILEGYGIVTPENASEMTQ